MQSHDELALEEEMARVPLRRATLARIGRYVKPHRRALFGALGVEAIWVGCMMLDVWLLGRAIDGAVADRDPAAAALWACALVANLAFRAWVTVWELRVSTRVGTDIIHALRKDVFDHVQRLSMRYFDRTKQGRIIARVDRDVDSLDHLIQWGPIVVVSLGISMILGTVFMLFEAPRLALVCLASLPVLWGVTRLFERVGFPAYRKVREAHSAISAHVAETITGVRVVQSFSAEPKERGRLAALHERYRGAVMGSWRIAGAYIPALTLAYFAILVWLLWTGGSAIADGSLTAGSLTRQILLLGMVLGPIEGLGALYNEALVAGAAAERVFLLLDTTPDVQDRPGAADPGEIRGAVAFESVSFSYDPEGRNGKQLAEVTFAVEPGRTVALVGHTGAGKTSVASLVARFYEAQEGRVLVDGRDIRDIPQAALRRRLGIVPQESFLFAGTVLDNLRFANEGLSAEDAARGFAELGCDHVLAGLPDGLSTDVGERGANLSEGERQIVCFVRALLARPAILILDEATSAVDTRTESTILTALRRLSARQTTFIIAHRLSTIREADEILVLEGGRIVERGRHGDLMSRGGAYASLYAAYAK
ncbi:MAG: putative ABC transporter ATP-binding protein [Planctomycetes bacterium]|nr:putative ABC transporter ATP-binding protein [Planctomycetota bacterium]